jgi:ABC-2 type transport system permease protein
MAAGRSGTGAYTQSALLLYFLYASGHTIIQESRVSWNLSMGIRMGKLAASLLRPYPYLVSVVCSAAAFATIRFVILALLFAGVIALSDDLQAAAQAVSADTLARYVGVLALSLAIGWVLRIGIGLLAFDMTQTWGPELIFMSFYVAASGVSFPPDLLPAWIHQIVTWTPVYYMVGFPSLVLLGRVDGAAFDVQLTRGAVVFGLTALVVWLEWRRGMKKFEAVGI